MASIWKPQDIEVYKGWVEAIICEAQDRLTDWETNFIHDIEARLTIGRNLTENQANVLERIYAQKTS